jgi:hypothetical protein
MIQACPKVKLNATPSVALICYVFTAWKLGKSKVVLTLKSYAMKTYGGVDGIVPLILTSALDGDAWSASRSLPLYPQENSLRHPLHRKLKGTESRSGRYGEQKNLLPLSEMEPRLLDRAVSSLVTISSDVSSLRIYSHSIRSGIKYLSNTLAWEADATRRIIIMEKINKQRQQHWAPSWTSWSHFVPYHTVSAPFTVIS